MKIKKRSIGKLKRLFKFAMMKQPDSINSLKRSLSISNANIQAFASNISEFNTVKITKTGKLGDPAAQSKGNQNSSYKNMEKQAHSLTNLWSSQKQIVQQINRNKIKDKSCNLQEKNIIVSKSFKLSQIPIQSKSNQGESNANSKMPLHCSQYEFVVPKPNEQAMRGTKRQYWNINQPKSKPFGPSKHKKLASSPKSSQKSQTNTQRFWCVAKQREKKPSKLVRYKTEPNDKSINNLTNYDQPRNTKAFHYLVLQLQINLEVQKQVKSKTHS